MGTYLFWHLLLLRTYDPSVRLNIRRSVQGYGTPPLRPVSLFQTTGQYPTPVSDTSLAASATIMYPYSEQWPRAIPSHSRTRSSTAKIFFGSKTLRLPPYSERRQTSSSILIRNSITFFTSPRVRGRPAADLGSSFSGGSFSFNASEISWMPREASHQRTLDV